MQMGIASEAKQSLILETTEFVYFILGTYRQFGKVLAVRFRKEYEIKTLETNSRYRYSAFQNTLLNK